MKAGILYRMILEFVEDGGLLLAVVEHEVYDEGSGGFGDTLEFLFIDGEENALGAVAIKIAGNETLFAESLDDGLVANLTDLAFQFKMLHFVCFKMCYSIPDLRGGRNPIAPKSRMSLTDT